MFGWMFRLQQMRHNSEKMILPWVSVLTPAIFFTRIPSMSKEYREIEYTVTAGDGIITAGDVMRERLMLSSREVSRCKSFEDGVMRAGNPIWLKEELTPGETLTVRLYEDIENSSPIIPSDEPIDIIYEDEDLILLNKRGDLVVHPSYAHYTDSLSNALAGYYKKTGQEHVMRVIGRLDRETSGLIIFAKNRHSASILSHQSANMSRRKEYLALCSGIFDKKEGTVDAPIERIPGQRMIREVRSDGKSAITHYSVVEEYNGFSLVRLRLDTGRTHQIRVHMSYLGHPLLGDNLYGKEIEDNRGLTRAALHACHLEFDQPITGEHLSFDADIPKDMKAAMNDD